MITSNDDLELRLRAAMAAQADAVTPPPRLDDIRSRTAARAWFPSPPVLVATVAAVVVLLVVGGLQLRPGDGDRARLVPPAAPGSVSPAPVSPEPTGLSTPGPVVLARGASPVEAVVGLLGRYGLAERVRVGEATTPAGGHAEVALLPVDGPPSAGPVGSAQLRQQDDGVWVVASVASESLAVSRVDRAGTSLLVTGTVSGYDRAVEVSTYDAGFAGLTGQASTGSVSVTTGWQVRVPTAGQVLVATVDAGYGGVGALVVMTVPPAG